jgi:hypothetical protein
MFMMSILAGESTGQSLQGHLSSRRIARLMAINRPQGLA